MTLQGTVSLCLCRAAPETQGYAVKCPFLNCYYQLKLYTPFHSCFRYCQTWYVAHFSRGNAKEQRTPHLSEPETYSKFLFVAGEMVLDTVGVPSFCPPLPWLKFSATSLLWDFRQIPLPLPTSVFSPTKRYLHHRAVVRIKWEDTLECTVLCSEMRQACVRY